jgi:hypothetical protein
MSADRKRKLLQTEMAGYQALREKIITRRKPDRAPEAEKAAAPAAPATAGVVTPEILAQAIQDLKRFIRSELDRLKEGLRAASRRT